MLDQRKVKVERGRLVSINTFGVFSYRLADTKPSSLNSRKAEALLLCLVLCGANGFEREQLSRMLWPDLPDHRAKASLRQAIARIRRTLGDVFEAPRPGWIALAQDQVDCDLWRVRETCGRARSTDWSEYPTEPFLVNYAVPTDLFSEWVERAIASQRRALKQELLVAIANTGFPSNSRDGFAQTALLLDPTDEETVAVVLDLLIETGRTKQYVDVLSAYRTRLKFELDLEPSAEFTAEYQSVPVTSGNKVLAELPADRERDRTRFSRPLLTITPFEVQSSGPDLAFLRIAIAEEIVSQLATQNWFYVNTPDTGPLYRSPQVGHQRPEFIHNAYSMSGVILEHDSKVQISIRLVDEGTSAIIWSKAFHVDARELSTLRSRLAGSMSELLSSKVIAAESVSANTIAALETHDDWVDTMKARYLFWRMNKRNNAAARALLDGVMERSSTPAVPTFVVASFSRLLDVWSLWSKQPNADLEEAITLADRSTRVHPTDPWTYFTLGTALGAAGDLDLALSTLERALVISPNFAPAIGTKGKYQLFNGALEEAKENLHTAMRLNNLDTHFGLWQNAMGIAAFIEGDLSEAIDWANRAISTNNYWAHNHLLAAVIFQTTAQESEARKSFQKAEKHLPGMTKQNLAPSFAFKHMALQRVWFDPLTKLGLRER